MLYLDHSALQHLLVNRSIRSVLHMTSHVLLENTVFRFSCVEYLKQKLCLFLCKSYRAVRGSLTSNNLKIIIC